MLGKKAFSDQRNQMLSFSGYHSDDYNHNCDNLSLINTYLHVIIIEMWQLSLLSKHFGIHSKSEQIGGDLLLSTEKLAEKVLI